MIPDSVFTFTITASRLTARPMPRRTLLSLGRGNDVGIAVISAILRAASNLGKGEFIAGAGPIRLPDHSKPALAQIRAAAFDQSQWWPEGISPVMRIGILA